MNAIAQMSLEDFADALLAETGGDVDAAAISAAQDAGMTVRIWQRFMLERAGQQPTAEKAGVAAPATLHSDPDRSGHLSLADIALLRMPAPVGALSPDPNRPGQTGVALKADHALPAPVRTPNPSRINATTLRTAAGLSSLLDTFRFSNGQALREMTVGQLHRLEANSARDLRIAHAIRKSLPQTPSGTTLVRDAISPRRLARILERFHG